MNKHTEDINPLLKETFIFRPLDRPMLRYANGEWIPDDGEPDMAFILPSPAVVYVDMPRSLNLVWSWPEDANGRRTWHHCTIDNKAWDDERRWEERCKHPNEVAGRSGMDKCCKLHGIASGRSIPLTQDNEYLKRGLLIIQSSGKPVTRPENPVCYLCLNDGRGHYLAGLWKQKWEAEGDKESLETDIVTYERRLAEAKDDLEAATQKLEEVTALLVAEGEIVVENELTVDLSKCETAEAAKYELARAVMEEL